MTGDTGGRSDGRIADNVLLFCRTLRAAGIPVGPGQVIEAAHAILATGLSRRDDFFYALRAVLIKDPAWYGIFAQAFHVYFRNPRLLERMMGLLLPSLEDPSASDDGVAAIRRLIEALAADANRNDDDVAIEIDRAGSYSPAEQLGTRDFEQMSLDEQEEARRLLTAKLRFAAAVTTRRFRSGRSGRHYDLRRTMQLMARNSGQPLELARKKRRRVTPTLVLLCDISGSMSSYSRMFLHFAHVMRQRRRDVHCFVFGTRLTNVSRWLAERDVDRAMALIAAEVRDFDGGTRIRDSIARFNREWARRVLAGRSITVLMSDGLERQSRDDLGFQVERLHRCTDRLVWLNPMLRYDRFEPKARGIQTILPHVDDFLPAHNVRSLVALSELLDTSTSTGSRLAA